MLMISIAALKVLHKTDTVRKAAGFTSPATLTLYLMLLRYTPVFTALQNWILRKRKDLVSRKTGLPCKKYNLIKKVFQ